MAPRRLTGTANPIPPASTPGETTGYFYAYDSSNQPVSGATFQLVLMAGDGTTGRSFPRDFVTVTSDSNGLVTIAHMLQSASWQIRRQKTSGHWGPWTEFTTGEDTTTALPEILGKIG